MEKQNVPQIAVVIPVYNEQDILEKVITDWLKILTALKVPFKLLLINDGSTDQSSEVIHKLEKQNPNYIIGIHQKNAGHGAAVLNGYKKALDLKSQWVFQCDSDDQIAAEEFVKFWPPLANTKFAIGQRKKRFDPQIRLFITKINAFLNRLLFGPTLPDLNCPFRLMEGQTLSQSLLNIPENCFAPNIHLAIEFSSLCNQRNFPMSVFQVTHKERATGTPSIKGIWRLLKICLRVTKELMLHRFKIFCRPGIPKMNTQIL